MTLYRKYRPQTIDELDLDEVRNRLAKLSASVDKLPHAFLFAGPRGAGKTSAARILAKIVNCENPVKTKNGLEPCNKCSQCTSITSGQSLDVVELDTASNRGIDDIRALRETIALSPARAKKKVYIMDEAHMLTVEAANAFLKTLEEPPSHAVFILATTDPHKIPETVRSRLTLISFSKANEKEVRRQLERIISGEKFDVEDGVLELIAKRADGSFREAVKILETLSLDDPITKEKAEKYLYSGSASLASDLVSLVLEKKVESAISQVEHFASSGGSIKDLIDDMQSILRGVMLENIKEGKSASDEIKLIKALMEARYNLGKALLPEIPLEIAIVECAEDSPSGESPHSVSVKRKLRSRDSKKKVVASASQIDASLWSEILQKTRVKNTALEAVLRTAKPLGIDGNTVNLAVYYQFHKERLEKDQYKKMVEEVVEEVMGIAPAKIACQLEELPAELVSEPKFESLTVPPQADIIQAAKEIFGE